MHQAKSTTTFTLRDFIRPNKWSALLSSLIPQSWKKEIDAWKAMNPHAWKLGTVFLEECLRKVTRNAVSDVLLVILRQLPQGCLWVHSLATRHDRTYFEHVDQFFLANSWSARYARWLMSGSHSSTIEPHEIDFPTVIDKYLISNIADFISGEYILPRFARLYRVVDLRSPFPSRAIALCYYTACFIGRGGGRVPGLLFRWQALSYWTELVVFSVLNMFYIQRYVLHPLMEGDNATQPSYRNTDFYDALDIESTATKDEILKAYKKKSLELHPDRNIHLQDEQRFIVQENFKVVNEAKRILSDSRARFLYDQNLTTGLSPHGESFFDHDMSRQQELEELNDFFQRYFSSDAFRKSWTGVKQRSLLGLMVGLPGMAIVSFCTIVVVPLSVHLNIVYWQHVASDAGSLFLRVAKRLLVSLLV